MSHIGILLACDHYPAVEARPEKIDRQLRLWLEQLGHKPDQISVYKAYDQEFPQSSEADVWIASGNLTDWHSDGTDIRGQLFCFLRGVAALGLPIFGLHHGEHLLHQALAEVGAKPPATRAHLLSIRNPFRSFHQSDAIFSFVAANRTVQQLQRPGHLVFRPSLAAFLRAA